MRRVHGFAEGRVQGVFFRSQVQGRALELKLTGWVKNISDGRVEFVAEGPKSEVEKFLDHLRSSPGGSDVEHLEVDDEKPTGEFDSFNIRY